VWGAGARCSVSVRYRSGARQKGLKTLTAANGSATWTWTVPRNAQPGLTHDTASCAGAGAATRTMTVIGQVVPPKIDVVQSGWSTRTYQYGGTGVSWGAILANRSQTQDALDVQVPCNFVMAANRLIGSSSVHISDLAAGTSHPTGGELTFPEGAPVARLEHPRRRHGHPGRDPAASSSGGDEDHDGHASDPDEQSGFGPRRRQSEVQALLVFREDAAVPRPLAKRLLDVLVAAFLLLVLSPLFVAVVVAYGFRPFYREPRISRGRTFGLLKFRTLRAEVLARAGGHARPLEADPANLTWLGRHVLKPWYFDETPQLWNVLRGDFSLVGPRPWPPELVERQRAEGLTYRDEVAAGLTGPAQLSKGSKHQYADLDLQYVAQVSNL